MNLVDVHCHLTHDLFKNDLDAVLARAKKAGVKAILVSGVNPTANKEVLKLIQKDPIMKASLGVYPIDALGLAGDATGLPLQTTPINLEEEFVFFNKNRDQITAIGEIGMDFHWATKEETQHRQEDNFRKIIRFAISIKKPIVIHTRKAEKECLDVLEEEIKNKEIPVNLHCFSGNKKLVHRAVALGYHCSIPANILRSSQFEIMVGIIPISQLLTETDAPWLTPYAGQQNEPAFVLESVKKIAEVKKIPVEEAAEIIWQNYGRIFGKT